MRCAGQSTVAAWAIGGGVRIVYPKKNIIIPTSTIIIIIIIIIITTTITEASRYYYIAIDITVVTNHLIIQ